MKTTTMDALVEVTDALKEAHQDEIDNGHYGDGKASCSYCKTIKRAQRVIWGKAWLEANKE